MIALALLAAFVTYHYFGKNRDLKDPLEGLTVLPPGNPAAVNEYKVRMSRAVLKDTKSAVVQTESLIVEVKRKPDDDHSSECDKLERKLNERIQEFKARAAPQQYFAAHKQGALSLGQCYQALEALRQVRSADPKERQRLLAEASKLQQQALRNITQAQAEIK